MLEVDRRSSQASPEAEVCVKFKVPDGWNLRKAYKVTFFANENPVGFLHVNFKFRPTRREVLQAIEIEYFLGHPKAKSFPITYRERILKNRAFVLTKFFIYMREDG